MPNRCYMCKAEEETGYHLLLHCPKASTLWQLVCALFHIQWVMHSSMKGVLLSWNGVSVGKKRKKVWKVAPLCIFWSIWREWNRRAFEDMECLDQTFKSSFCIYIRIGLECTWVIALLFDRFCRLVRFPVGCVCVVASIGFLYMYTSYIPFHYYNTRFTYQKK